MKREGEEGRKERPRRKQGAMAIGVPAAWTADAAWKGADEPKRVVVDSEALMEMTTSLYLLGP
jgi:hypothetical protein